MSEQAPAPKASPLYLKRLLVGEMQNYVYLVGSNATRECLVVDPAWKIDSILRAAEQDEMKVVGALATHWHPDHVGGDLFGHDIEGLKKLLERCNVPIHVHRDDLQAIAEGTGLAPNDLRAHAAGDELRVGDVTLKLLHTPGHTAGSQCFLCHGNLISGDTLFFRGCGRVDLPGGDPAQMYRSLHQVLKRLPPETRLHPGHKYGPVAESTIGEELRENPYLTIPTLEEFLGAMGFGA